MSGHSMQSRRNNIAAQIAHRSSQRAKLRPSQGAALLWSAVALIFILLPGVLMALAGLPVWLLLGYHPAAKAALAGINAAVVGVLGAALYNSIWVSAVANGRDVGIALVGFLLLERWRVPPLVIVAFRVGAALISASVR
jgi:chromate transporter